MLNDLWLVLMVAIWALNLTVLKVIFREVPPLAANGVRFTVAALAFLGLIFWLEGGLNRLRRGDWLRVAALGLIGHTGYQVFFVLGLDRTSATHSALIFGTSPLVVAILSRLMGHERLSRPMLLGLISSALGVALTVTGRQEVAGVALSTLAGDLLVFVAVLCWGLYSVLSKPLLARYSPLKLTGLSMAIGSLPLIALALPESSRVAWGDVSLLAWGGIAFSSLAALLLCYLIWYRSVARVGNARTAVFGNVVPLAGPALASWLLGEPISIQLAFGGVLILGGIALTRVTVRASGAAVEPSNAPSPSAGSRPAPASAASFEA